METLGTKTLRVCLTAAVCVGALTACADSTTSPMIRVRPVASFDQEEDPPPGVEPQLYSGAFADATGESGVATGTANTTGGNAFVSVSGEASVAAGKAEPDVHPESCVGWNHCAWNEFFTINCSADTWTVTATSTASARWYSVRKGPKETSQSSTCEPNRNGGSSTTTTDEDCLDYVIEISNDGGQTWEYWGTASGC
jgi:hypothetical protein